jgi:2-methylcitrate dehydratase PrpD
MTDSNAALAMARPGVTRALTQWLATCSDDAVAPDALEVASHCLLDWVGVTLGGCNDDGPVMVRAEIAEQGGHPQATLVGTRERASAVQAALANGIASHALDFDDVHAQLNGHPTVAIMSAVLPLAERQNASGLELLRAFAFGVEFACRVGRYVGLTHYQRGWHATCTVGGLGAAAACARLLRLDQAGVARAIGLAASQAGGLKSMFGTMVKPLHAGKAASVGLSSTLLAARGFTAREDVLECEQGFNAVLGGDGNAEAALADLDTPRAVREVLFKYHAACYGTHAGIDALRGLREDVALVPDNITRIDLHVPHTNLSICNIAEPKTGLEAKFSMRLTAAMAVLGEATGDSETYTDALCARDDIQAIRDRVHINVASDGFGYGTEAVVHLADGVVHRNRADVGTPEPDLSRQQDRLSSKFAGLAVSTLGSRTEAVTEQLLGAAESASVRQLLEMCVPR